MGAMSMKGVMGGRRGPGMEKARRNALRSLSARPHRRIPGLTMLRGQRIHLRRANLATNRPPV
jgi:hypothetical protein